MEKIRMYSIIGLALTCLTVGLAAESKSYSWGQVSWRPIADNTWEVDLEVVWPSPSESSGGLPFDLPGAVLTPEDRSTVPWTIGALLEAPMGQEVEWQLMSVDSVIHEGVAGSDVDRYFRVRRYEAHELGASTVPGSQLEDGNLTNGSDESGHPSVVAVGWSGWLRGHRLVSLRCHPLRVFRSEERVERVSHIRGRLIFSEPLSESEWGLRRERFATPAFAELVASQVINPSVDLPLERVTKSNRPESSRPEGARRLAESLENNAGELLRIEFQHTGMYRLSVPLLSSRGLDLEAIDPATFQLFDHDEELPLWVSDGGDGRLDGSDSIIFYGRALDSIYSLNNSYVLRWADSEGLRMTTRSGEVQGVGTFPSEFVETERFEQDSHYWQNMVNGEGEDHWFWESQFVRGERREYVVNLVGVAAASSGSVVLRVELKGLTSIPEVLNDHHTRVYLNGVLVSDELWDGNSRFVHTGSLGVSAVREGSNTVSVEVVGDTASLDQVFLDGIEFDYPRRLAAVDGELALGGQLGGGDGVAVTGFRNADVDVFDVSDPSSIERVVGNEVVLETQGFRTAYTSMIGRDSRYEVVDSLAYRQPDRIELREISGWRHPRHQADYLIVSHRPFIEALAPLVAKRRSEGVSVAVVPVDELYSEFTSGLETPAAITEFVRYAYHQWQAPAPTYLLLVGDSTLDPRDIFGTGTPNYLPSEITEMNFFGESVTDDGFVRVDGDDFLPDLLVGRFPGESRADVATMVEKTLSYEALSPFEDWNRNVLVVADDDVEAYEALSESLVERLPENFDVERVFLSQYPPGSPTPDIFRHVNEGQVMVNYTGHGSRATWGVGDISGILFENADAAVLTNSERLTVVTVANCLNGFFVARTAKPCLAEVFLRNSAGGAVGVWAPTSLGFPSGHRLLVGEFYDAVFQEGQIGLGAAVLGAKLATLRNADFFADQVKSYTYFGDPAMRLALPNRVPAVVVDYILGEQQLEVHFDVVAGFDYTVLRSEQLGSGADWTPVSGAPHNSGTVSVSLDGGVAAAFFRVDVTVTGNGNALLNQ